MYVNPSTYRDFEPNSNEVARLVSTIKTILNV